MSFVWQQSVGACWCKNSTQIGVNVHNSLISGIFSCTSTATNVTAFIQKGSLITMSLLEIEGGFVINVLLDCPVEKYCPKYGVEYEGRTIVEGI